MRTTKLQNLPDFSGQKFYIGIDVHKNSWAVSIRSLQLHIEQFSQPPSVKTLINHLHKNIPVENTTLPMKRDSVERVFMKNCVHKEFIISLSTRQTYLQRTSNLKTKQTFMTAALLPSTWRKVT